MIWFILEHWFTLGLAGAYIAAVGLAYVRFGRSAAIAVALLGAGAFLYRRGQNAERDRQRQQAERARQQRQEVEQNVGAMGEEDVHRELDKWNRD